MTGPGRDFRRGNLRKNIQRDSARFQGRLPNPFWKSIALIGSIGWPIALSAIGGVLLGRYLDARWGTGIRLTLILLFLFVSLGCYGAFRSATGGKQ